MRKGSLKNSIGSLKGVSGKSNPIFIFLASSDLPEPYSLFRQEAIKRYRHLENRLITLSAEAALIPYLKGFHAPNPSPMEIIFLSSAIIPALQSDIRTLERKHDMRLFLLAKEIAGEIFGDKAKYFLLGYQPEDGFDIEFEKDVTYNDNEQSESIMRKAAPKPGAEKLEAHSSREILADEKDPEEDQFANNVTADLAKQKSYVFQSMQFRAMLAESAGLFAQEVLLRLHRKDLDNLEPGLYPRYVLFNTLALLSHYVYLSCPKLAACKALAGSLNTDIEFALNNDGSYEPASFSMDDLRATSFPVLLHEMAEGWSMGETAFTAGRMIALPDHVQDRIWSDLSSVRSTVYRYLFGPGILRLLRRYFRVFSDVDLSQMSIAEARHTKRRLESAVGGEQPEAARSRFMAFFSLFAELPPETRYKLLQKMTAAKTTGQRRNTAEMLRQVLGMQLER